MPSPQPAIVRPGLDPKIDEIIQRMLSFSPVDRYADATLALEDLDQSEVAADTSKPIFRRGFLAAAVLLIALAVAVAIGNRIRNPVVLTDSQPASVLLADFENKTGDAYYDLTVSQLFALAMEQSQYLNVMSRYRVSEAVARSKVPVRGSVTLPVALGIAKAEGAKFVLSGDIERRAGQLVLNVRVNDTKSGKEAKVFSAGFSGAETLAQVAQNLTKEAREWFGEPLTRINETSIPLDQATTRSAIAWERFSRAARTESLGPKYLSDAATLLKSAVDVDPNFAMAHGQLAVMQTRMGNLGDGLASISRAYRLSNGATPREKYRIIGQYHSLRYELDKALEAFRTLVLLYPYDDLGHRYYAQTLSNVLLTKEAITESRIALALNPRSAINKGTLAITLALANENDQVIAMMDDLRKAGTPSLEPFEGHAWLGKGDFGRAREVFEEIAMLPESQGNTGRLVLAEALIYEGNLEEAASKLEVDLTNDVRLRDERLAVQRRNWLGWIRALQGNRAAAGNFAKALLQAAEWPINVRELRSTGVMLAEIKEVPLAEQVLERLESFVKAGFEGRVFTSAVAQLKGEIARARGQKEEARKALDEASLQWDDVLMLWSVARLSEDLGDFQRARNSYRAILNREGEIIRSHFPGLKSLALAGAARCELALGEREQAAKDFEEFFKTLGQHSPDLMLVKVTRQQQQNARLN